jgi:glucose dehydrogenase
MAPIGLVGPSHWLTSCLLAFPLLGCGPDRPRQTVARTQFPNAALARPDTRDATFPDDGEWRIPAKSYAATRFSGLDQITVRNVAQLQPAFTFSTGVLRGHEAVPIVANNGSAGEGAG